MANSEQCDSDELLEPTSNIDVGQEADDEFEIGSWSDVPKDFKPSFIRDRTRNQVAAELILPSQYDN